MKIVLRCSTWLEDKSSFFQRRKTNWKLLRPGNQDDGKIQEKHSNDG